MTGYLAAVFLATVCMLMLHVNEWRNAYAMALRVRSGSRPVAEAHWLRKAIRLEALYYFLILPYVYLTSHTLPGRLLAFAALYHWGGLAFSEQSGLFDKWAAEGGAASRGRRIGAIWAVAVLDGAEMLLLGWFLWMLLARLTGITGVPAFHA